MVQQCLEAHVDDVEVVATAEGVEPVDSDALHQPGARVRVRFMVRLSVGVRIRVSSQSIRTPCSSRFMARVRVRVRIRVSRRSIRMLCSSQGQGSV